MDHKDIHVIICYSNERKYRVTYDSDDRIEDVKYKIQDFTGYPPEYIRIIHNHMELDDDDKSLYEYNVKENDTLRVVFCTFKKE